MNILYRLRGAVEKVQATDQLLGVEAFQDEVLGQVLDFAVAGSFLNLGVDVCNDWVRDDTRDFLNVDALKRVSCVFDKRAACLQSIDATSQVALADFD